jgi:hypothetical protein
MRKFKNIEEAKNFVARLTNVNVESFKEVDNASDFHIEKYVLLLNEDGLCEKLRNLFREKLDNGKVFQVNKDLFMATYPLLEDVEIYECWLVREEVSVGI